MAERTFILIPGRTARQGTGLNQGKYSEDYLDETETLLMAPEDMGELGIKDGDRVRLTTVEGETILRCKRCAKEEVPPGLLFLAYGPPVCALIGGDTHGSGMPDSKGFDVRLERLSSNGVAT